MAEDDNSKRFSLITDYDGNEEHLSDADVNGEIPVLPLRNMALFPGIIIPCSIGRSASLRLVRKANKDSTCIAVTSQVNPDTDEPDFGDLYKTGTVARVLRVVDLPDNSHIALLQGFAKCELLRVTSRQPYLKGNVRLLEETVPPEDDKEFAALADACREMTERYLKQNDTLHGEPIAAIRNMKNKAFLVNFVCTNLPFSIKEKNELLAFSSLSERAYKLLAILNREVQFAALKADIRNKTREELDRQQKEYFLQQQIKNIQNELGETPHKQDIKELADLAAKKNLPDDIRKYFNKEQAKLERVSPQNPDYSIQLNYLQTLLSLPWGVLTKDDTDVKRAKTVLDRDHYGLEKVKERILEHLAVLTLRKDLKSPIICLYGPPGVGKTSLGKSIASALKRKYVRVSLGGLHDEAEIRGHRRTYIGAMPGRIVKGIIKAGADNPVFILDEVDKITSNNYNGDPSSALLEVLDPEQNSAFHDNFIDVDYDLSKVMFIATANSLASIPPALLDRMELIEVSGYLTEEKIEISRRHLIPKEMKNTGIGKGYDIRFSKKSLETLIERYTRESGVRDLELQINKIFRKIAYRIVAKIQPDFVGRLIQPEDIETLLGKPPYLRDTYQGNKYAGVVTGLAWTSVGGEILFIETSLSKGKGSKLTLTGNLGEVMKESAVLALEYIKAHVELLNIDYKIFDHWNIHIHVPEGATPKDGPSAGITIATSIASALTQRKVRPNVAMTGEITLRGKVLPVGGIKEKILAAKRAGITDIVISKDNKKDIEEIPEIYLKGLAFNYVENVKEVLEFALLEEKVDDAAVFAIDENEDVPQTKSTHQE